MSDNKATISKIGKHIAELRKDRGYTQRTLSELVYVGEKTVSKWERGIVAPDIAMIKTLSDIFDVSVDELLSGEKIESKNGENTINAIKVYSKQSKIKLFKLSLFLILLIIILFSVIFVIDNHYKWKVKQYNVSGVFSVTGYSFKNNFESKIVIDKIIYNDPNEGTKDEIKTDYLKVMILSEDKEICSKQIKNDYYSTLRDILKNYSFFCEVNKSININELSLVIKYEKDDSGINNIIKLN